MSTYMITGEGKEQFYNQLKKLLSDKVNGINAIVLHIEDDTDLSLESYEKILNETNKAFNLTKIHCQVIIIQRGISMAKQYGDLPYVKLDKIHITVSET